MKIWVTGDCGPATLPAVDRLRIHHDVVVSDATLDPLDPEQVTPMVAGVDALLHPASIADACSNEETLDRAARGAYVVLTEAVKGGVGRAVLVSDLSCFADYPSDYVIDETFCPRPNPDAASLAPLLAERTFREFSRQECIQTLCLRFGSVDVPGGTPSGMAVDAIDRALTNEIERGTYRSWLFHVADSNRFPLEAAKGKPLVLGQKP